ncbi:MAG: shikimate dehydrogenase [Lachnospiraceae bacterium]|nr:shikimate dehydrogenase [Lachnospiraceae bacterium]
MEYGLIGEKLGHSFSREIHEKLRGYAYELRELRPEEVGAFLAARVFRGINVTIPYKETVIPYLDEIDEAAREIGAVNTVVNRGGKLYGYNTDFLGMRELMLREGIDPAGKKVLVLGSGGTSKTAMTVAKSLGVSVVLRVSRQKRDDCITYEEAHAEHADAEIIINATPVGMYPNTDASPVDLADYPKLSGVVDAIYNPLRTKLVLAAKERGIRATGGLFMLVGQAAAAAEHFTGVPGDPADVARVYGELLSQKENLVITGMPGVGKTTVGKLIAKHHGREFVDCDDVIVERAGCDIPTIFATQGEKAFRDLESAVIRDLSTTGGKVIAPGGGAVLRPENVEALRANGRIIFLDRPPSSITATEGRPLSANREALEARYRERYPIYCATCDAHVETDGTIAAVEREVWAAFAGQE